MNMNRRFFFGLLAGLPSVGRWFVAAKPVTHVYLKNCKLGESCKGGHWIPDILPPLDGKLIVYDYDHPDGIEL